MMIHQTTTTIMPRVLMQRHQEDMSTPGDLSEDDGSVLSATSKESRTSSTTTSSRDSQDSLEGRALRLCGDRTSTPTASELNGPVSTIAVILPEKYDSSLDILRTFSSESMHIISKSNSADPDYDRNFGTASEPSTQIPRRNLTEAFEELYIQPSGSSSNGNSDTPSVKQSDLNRDDSVKVSMISPTGVTDLDRQIPAVRDPINLVTPTKDDDSSDVVKTLERPSDERASFTLHETLQRDLSDTLVQRVSLYAIIHDINKEVVSMASNDDSGYYRTEEVSEEYDPLVAAMNGYPATPFNGQCSMLSVALIDEEQWLLEAVDARSGDETRSVNACPPTFLQAMGERDYENPLSSLSNGSRTQLWKPSRSWWEAKSGKNPWIEPKCHNKRWRYLWPLIHYHKFLAKCIKKLKRNGIDVKTSVSPVSVFLREEVCAVSDHLASVSLFASDEWMSCLQHFNGWTESSESAERESRESISKLKLRPLNEPGDADSSLLRSQIDAHYLRAMASARAQLIGADVPPQEKRQPKEPMRRRESNSTAASKQSSFEAVAPTVPPSRQGSTASFQGHAPASMPPGGVPTHHWPGYNPPQGGWWQNSWHHHAPYTYGDDTSVQSALSGDTSFSHGYMNGYVPGAIHHSQQYYPPMIYPQHPMMHGAPGAYDPSSATSAQSYLSDGYTPQHIPGAGWTGHPLMGHVSNIPAESSAAYSTMSNVVSPTHDVPSYQYERQGEQTQTIEDVDSRTPYKYPQSQVSMTSPYWSHLQDHATLSMMGLASPSASVPSTPHHGDQSGNRAEGAAAEQKNELNAQPLLLRQSYYGYGYGSREGYAPPSPATQFMMSPQPGFAYNYGYGFSPRRQFSQKKLAKNSISEEGNDARTDESEGGKTNSETTSPSRPATKQRESPDESVSSKS